MVNSVGVFKPLPCLFGGGGVCKNIENNSHELLKLGALNGKLCSIFVTSRILNSSLTGRNVTVTVNSLYCRDTSGNACLVFKENQVLRGI